MTNNKPADKYSAKNLQSLTPREHVRRRPGMYIGGTDTRGLHHLIWAATDHMIEEAMVGLCSYIYIHILDNNKILIENDSAFLLEGKETFDSVSEQFSDLLLELKWRTSISEMFFGVQGDLHSIGLGIASSLSGTFQLEIQQNGDCWSQQYTKGLPIEDLQHAQSKDKKRQRTRITLTPDFSVMDENDFQFDTIATRFQDLSYLMPGVAFQIEDNRQGGNHEQYLSTQGLTDRIDDTRNNYPLHKAISGEATSLFVDSVGKNFKARVQFAFQFTASRKTDESSFINTVSSPDGGTHIEGLHRSILDSAFTTSDIKPDWDDISAGFIGTVHLLHPKPEFEGRTRMKITNSEAYELVEIAIQDALKENQTGFEEIRELLLSRI